MKKYIKIFFINILFIIALIVFIEAVSFKILQSRDHNFHYIFSDQKFEDKYENGDFHRQFRPIQKGKNKKTILLFGCCMTHGTGIQDERESLSYTLNKYTNMTVINRGFQGWGLQHMYYQLTDPHFPDEIGTKPDYIVYTIIKDHYRRLFSNSSANEPFYLTYKLKNGLLEENTNQLMNRSLFVYLMKSLYCQYFYNQDTVDFYILKSYEKAKQLWPDVKFIILDMDNISSLKNSSALKDKGIEVIELMPYTDNKNIHELPDLWSDNSGHPNGKYWDIIVKNIKDIFK